MNVVNVPILMIATAVAGFGAGLSMPLQYSIQADNTDYVELKLGYRAEGAIASLSSLLQNVPWELAVLFRGIYLHWYTSIQQQKYRQKV